MTASTRSRCSTLLAGLVAKSLVVADAERTETRYRLLETIRQYAQEHLAETDGSAATRVRHARYYTDLAESVAPRLAGPDEDGVRGAAVPRGRQPTRRAQLGPRLRRRRRRADD